MCVCVYGIRGLLKNTLTAKYRPVSFQNPSKNNTEADSRLQTRRLTYQRKEYNNIMNRLHKKIVNTRRINGQNTDCFS